MDVLSYIQWSTNHSKGTERSRPNSRPGITYFNSLYVVHPVIGAWCLEWHGNNLFPRPFLPFLLMFLIKVTSLSTIGDLKKLFALDRANVAVLYHFEI